MTIVEVVARAVLLALEFSWFAEYTVWARTWLDGTDRSTSMRQTPAAAAVGRLRPAAAGSPGKESAGDRSVDGGQPPSDLVRTDMGMNEGSPPCP